MFLKDNAVISIMKNSIMFLRICFLFPSSEEIKNPGRNVFIKFTVMFLVSSYFPIGIILNLIKNIKSKLNNLKYQTNFNTSITPLSKCKNILKYYLTSRRI